MNRNSNFPDELQLIPEDRKSFLANIIIQIEICSKIHRSKYSLSTKTASEPLIINDMLFYLQSKTKQLKARQALHSFPNQDGSRNVALDEPTWSSSNSFFYSWQPCNRCSRLRNTTADRTFGKSPYKLRA